MTDTKPTPSSHVRGIGVVVAVTGGPGDKCLINGNSWEESTVQTVDVLCQCGWGLLSVPEGCVPACCPACDFRFKPTPAEEDRAPLRRRSSTVPVSHVLFPSSEEEAGHQARFLTATGKWRWRKLVDLYGADEVRRAFEFHDPCDEGALEDKYRAWCLRNNHTTPEED